MSLFRSLLMQGGSTPPLLEPLVYFDIRKQGTVNSDESNRDTLVDYSGKGNNGTLNYFNFSDIYIDDQFSIVDSLEATVENHIITIVKDFSKVNLGSYIIGSKVNTEDSQLYVPSFQIKVKGLTSGFLRVGPINSSFLQKISINQDGIYTVPSYTVTGEISSNRRAIAFYSYPFIEGGINSGVTIEIYPLTYDGYVEKSIDDIVEITNSAYGTYDEETHKFTVTLADNSNATILDTLTNYNRSEKIQFPSYKVKVQGIGTGIMAFGYSNQYEDTPLLTITADGTYTVPGFKDIPTGFIGIIPLSVKTNSPVPVGCTIEFLPQTEYIQFNPPLVEGPYEYITLPSNNTQGYKTVFALVEIPENFEREQLYWQNSGSTGLCSIDIFPSEVVSGENPDGDCFINGKLNTQVVGSSLGGKIILITCRNQNNLGMASPRGEIGYTVGWANHFKLYKFLGFSECLTDSQINQIIEDYGLMELVDYIDVQ